MNENKPQCIRIKYENNTFNIVKYQNIDSNTKVLDALKSIVIYNLSLL